MSSKKITILGSGSFGSALAKVLEEQGHQITLWHRDAESALKMITSKQSLYLPDVSFGKNITITHELPKALHGSQLILIVIPFQNLRNLLREIKPYLSNNEILLFAAKGLEEATGATAWQITKEELSETSLSKSAFLSGPNFAKELANKLPTATVVASLDPSIAKNIQSIMSTFYFRIFLSQDVVGVCLGGALKNIYAIGIGISDGMKLGTNARAGLIARSLNEMTQLGTRLGANPKTFLGLSGLGDLVLTCTGDLSRNRRVGLYLGQGLNLQQAVEKMNEVAEGIATTRAVHVICQKVKISLPIAQHIYDILFSNLSPRLALKDLLERELAQEH